MVYAVMHNLERYANAENRKILIFQTSGCKVLSMDLEKFLLCVHIQYLLPYCL